MHKESVMDHGVGFHITHLLKTWERQFQLNDSYRFIAITLLGNIRLESVTHTTNKILFYGTDTPQHEQKHRTRWYHSMALILYTPSNTSRDGRTQLK